MAAILQPLGPGRQISVDRAVALIGRSNDCDVILETSTRISRIHCAIVQVNNKYFIRDLGSMNGVWCGGERVLRDLKLENGLEISIGDLRYVFIDSAVAPRSAAPVVQAAGQTPPIRAVQILPGNGISLDEPSDADTIRDQRMSAPSSDARFHSSDQAVQLDEVEVIDDLEVIDDEPDIRLKP
jgi:predicted component of type VI protein secretion system